MTRRNILFVFTSASQSLRGDPTGWYLPEAAHPYYLLASHHNIDFAAPKGPNPPLDQSSVEAFKEDDESVKFLNDDVVQGKLANAKVLATVNEQDYDAIFYVGGQVLRVDCMAEGHGPVIDLAGDEVNIKLASAFYRADKVTAAVCHGPAALTQATTATGESIMKSKAVTGFSNKEEEMAGKIQDVPFLLEDKIKELGGEYEKAAEPWGPKVIVDGHLITGQNPASARGVGEAILNALG